MSNLAFSWDGIFFRKSIPHEFNIKPIKEDHRLKALEKHFLSTSFLKTYVDRSLAVLKYPSLLVLPVDLGEHLWSFEQVTSWKKFSQDRQILAQLFSFFDFDFHFDYQGIHQTKSQLPYELNYRAVEEAVLTGFEAQESLVSYYSLYSDWSLCGHVALLEKYTSEKKDLFLDSYLRSYQQTLKYGMGLRWQKSLKAEKKLVIEAFFLQRSDNEWVVENFLFNDFVYKGICFDSWKCAIRFQF